MKRTTVSLADDDLETLRSEARRRGQSLGRLMADVLAQHARRLRADLRPHVGIGASGTGVARESVENEDEPAKAPFRG